MEVDNFDQPEASIYGRIIDSTTGENYLTDQGDVHIRIWEKSYSDNPNPQDLAVKMDGTYNRLHLLRVLTTCFLMMALGGHVIPSLMCLSATKIMLPWNLR